MARKRGKSKAFWRFSIAGMVAGVFGLFALIAFNMPPETDVQTACRIDGQDAAHTILLIDQSDPFSKNDFGWVEKFVDEEARSLPKYGRLTVVTPSVRDPYAPAQVFSRCSTGSAEAANPILENPRMIEDNWRSAFREPLGHAIKTVLEEDTAPSSPLAEALYAIFDRADFQSGVDHRRVVIVSDLMQNSKSFSMYKAGADFEKFRTTPLGPQIRDVGGVEVVARIVPRTDYPLPLSDLKDFWRIYFTEANARFSSVN